MRLEELWAGAPDGGWHTADYCLEGAAEEDKLREGVRAPLAPDTDGRVTHIGWANAVKGRVLK